MAGLRGLPAALAFDDSRASDSARKTNLASVRTVGGHGTLALPLLQAFVNRAPIDVREESFDVLGTLGWLIVQQVRMLPHVHHQHWIEARHVADLMFADPVVRQSIVRRILITDGPPNSAHLADSDEIRLPNCVAAEALLRRFEK